MSTLDDLTRLADLHRSGALTDDEFAQAKARVLRQEPEGDGRLASALNRLRRSRDDRWIGGVCGGLARSTGIEAWVWRLAVVLLALWGGSGVIAYVLLWIFVPQEPLIQHTSHQIGA
mgnify:CR=1 FL=1